MELSEQPVLRRKEAGLPGLLPPRQLRRAHRRPLPNNGDGTFTDVSAKAGIGNADGKGLGVSFADYDDDGFMDVYVANDSVQCFLFHNNGNGTFTEVGLLAGVGFNEDGKTFAGMGVDFADYDNDGRPDIIVTDLSNERYRLFRQNDDGSFRDATNMSGVGAATLPFSGWSTRFFDYDNDGWKDLFVAQGHVMDTIEKTSPNLRYLQPPLLLRNESGRFVRVMPGAAFRAGVGRPRRRFRRSGQRWRYRRRASATSGRTPSCCGMTAGTGITGSQYERSGSKSNRDGIGCRVKVVSASGLTQYFTVNTAVGYLSASDKRLLVGLGDDPVAKLVEIRWPSGVVQTFENVKAGADAGRDRAGLGRRANSMTRRWSPVDDHPPHCLRCSRARRAGRRSGRGSPRAASSRNPAASLPAVRFRRASRMSRAQAGLTQPVVYGGVDTQELHHRSRRLRRRVHRLRQRRLARSVRAERHAAGGAPPGATNRLYKNNRDGTFTDVTAKAGLTRTGWASAVTVGDYDNDGFDDLFITYYGQNVLYHNNGDGTFTDVTEKAGLRSRPPSATARAARGSTTIGTAASICLSPRI